MFGKKCGLLFGGAPRMHTTFTPDGARYTCYTPCILVGSMCMIVTMRGGYFPEYGH